MTKKNLLSTIILLIAFSCTSILALLTAKKITTPHQHSTDNPDFFMTDITYTKFNQEGNIQNKVQSDKIIHFITKNIYLFDKPNITIHIPNEQPWHITANKGKSEKGKSKIYLWDKVKIVRKAGINNLNFDIATTMLTVYPDAKFAQTKQPITIIQDNNIIKGIGAEADFKTGIIKLISEIKGLYQIE